jgi:hypothetical protein
LSLSLLLLLLLLLSAADGYTRLRGKARLRRGRC